MANRIDTLPVQKISDALDATKPQKRFTLSLSAQRFVRFMLSYGFLAIGAIFMLFPVFWMLTAALKPTWQITSRDIWIPSFWHKTAAGDSVRLVNLWIAPNENGEGTQDVILFGSKRQYVTMLQAENLSNIVAIPRDQAGAFEVISMDDMQLNGLKWNNQNYVLVGAEGDNLLAVAQSEIDMSDAVVVPKTQIREGERTDVQAGDYTLQARLLEIEGRGALNLIEAGPNIELSTVLPAAYAQDARLVPLGDLDDKKRLPIGNSEVDQYTLLSGSPDERYILIEQADWRPVIGIDVLNQHAFTIPASDFEAVAEPRVFNNGTFQVGNYTGEDGETKEVAVVVQQEIQTGATSTMLVLPVEYLDSVKVVMSSSLLEPYPVNVDGTAVRVKDFTHPSVEEENIDLTQIPDEIAIIGQRQDMGLIIPVSAVQQLYDVFNSDLQRNLSISFQFQNFVRAMIRQTGEATFLTFFQNSTIIAGLSIVGHLFSCTMVGYAFGRLRAPGKNILFAIVLATMMMPGFITVIPVYRIFRDLGMVDTLWPMFLRTFFGNAFLIFLLRQFFSTIPMELEEAARIDGASRLQTFFRILLPLLTPALATIVIFSFLWSWNNLFDAAIYLNSPRNYTVAIGLRQFLGMYQSEFNLLMAAATIVMLPTVLLFFFAQRYFIEGITLTGMKG
jgi:multiple sugar transport system permease protein